MFSRKTFAIQSSKFEGIFDKNPDFWWWYSVVGNEQLHNADLTNEANNISYSQRSLLRAAQNGS
jgi:hypothetical protein